MPIGQVAGLWRYPVKSLGGENIEHAELGARGLLGDRLWAVRDQEHGITASARRLPALLTATARYRDPVPPASGPGNVPEVEIAFPDGTVLSSSDPQIHSKLSDLAGRDVKLTPLPPVDDTSLHRLPRDQRPSLAALREDFGVAEGEKLPDASVVPMADLLTLARYTTPPGTFVDVAPVHVLTQTSLATIAAELGADLDVRRFRPNVLVALKDSDEEFPEAGWVGAHLVVGGAILDVAMPTLRCVVPSRAQPGLEVNRQITRVIAAKARRCLGVYCRVDSGGSVRVGDDVAVRAVRRRRGKKLLDDAGQRTKRIAFGLATAAADRLSR